MISRSRPAIIAVAFLVEGALIAGCGSGSDVGTANTEKIDKTAAAQLQQGANGTKAAHGGGVVDDPVPAAPGEKTGMLQGGRK